MAKKGFLSKERDNRMFVARRKKISRKGNNDTGKRVDLGRHRTRSLVPGKLERCAADCSSQAREEKVHLF